MPEMQIRQPVDHSQKNNKKQKTKKKQKQKQYGLCCMQRSTKKNGF